ncbi:MAG: hypothetical protein ABIE47_06655 [Pseudomonadota bacterium]
MKKHKAWDSDSIKKRDTWILTYNIYGKGSEFEKAAREAYEKTDKGKSRH